MVVVGAVIAKQASQGEQGVAVRIEAVETRDLEATVTASGTIEPTRSVDVASDITGQIIELAVDEGDFVRRGQLLLRIDPTQYQASVQRSEANVATARANALQATVNRDQAKRALDRLVAMWDRDTLLVSPAELETSQTNYDVAAANAVAVGVEIARAIPASSRTFPAGSGRIGRARPSWSSMRRRGPTPRRVATRPGDRSPVRARLLRVGRAVRRAPEPRPDRGAARRRARYDRATRLHTNPRESAAPVWLGTVRVSRRLSSPIGSL